MSYALCLILKLLVPPSAPPFLKAHRTQLHADDDSLHSLPGFCLLFVQRDVAKCMSDVLLCKMSALQLLWSCHENGQRAKC